MPTFWHNTCIKKVPQIIGIDKKCQFVILDHNKTKCHRMLAHGPATECWHFSRIVISNYQALMFKFAINPIYPYNELTLKHGDNMKKIKVRTFTPIFNEGFEDECGGTETAQTKQEALERFVDNYGEEVIKDVEALGGYFEIDLEDYNEFELPRD